MKNLLIISSHDDSTTNYVCEWLNFFKKDFFRINFEDLTDLKSILLNNNEEEIEISSFRINSISTVWHRRGRFRFLKNNPYLKSYLKTEEESIIKSLESFFRKKTKYVGSYNKEVETYKINQLRLAKQVGLKIPNTLITTCKEKLREFYKSNNKSIITKDLKYPINVDLNSFRVVSGGTSIVSKESIDSADSSFAPSLFQEMVKKMFEIRVFFWEEKLFPMAIFSQNDTQTKLDYRNYNEIKPNRCVPFKVPRDISNKIIKLNKLLDLNTGSYDFIMTNKNKIVFLEVNPMGQVDWLSKNCNYYIEKFIARRLNEEV